MYSYGALFDNEGLAAFAVGKLLGYGIEAYQNGIVVTYYTTPERDKTIRKLMDFWAGLRNEWWYALEGQRVLSFYVRGPYSQCKRAHDGSWDGGMDVLRFWVEKYNRKRKNIRRGKCVELEG